MIVDCYLDVVKYLLDNGADAKLQSINHSCTIR